MISNCNCGEKVECGCKPYFDSYETETVSVLSVGNMVSDFCEFDDYVIDWYKDGNWYMASAHADNADNNISAYHPFTGSAAIPVVSGTYVPVVRYAKISGEKIFLEPKPCQKWCDELTGLPVIVVNSLNCSTNIGSPAYGYTAKFSYNTTQDYSLASRTIRFDLDGDAWAFAVYFLAQQVADRCRITHSRTLQVLFDWIVGLTGTLIEYVQLPHEVPWIEQKAVFQLPEYQDGDYLLIDIFPSAKGANFNTIWQLNLACLKNQSFTKPVLSDLMRVYDIDTLSFTWDSVNCRFVLDLTFDYAFPSIEYYYYRHYTGLTSMTYNQIFTNGLHNGMYHTYNSRVLTYQIFYHVTDFSTKVSITNSITTSKSGNVITIVCSDQSDYNSLKNGYTAVMATAFYSGWLNDPTNIKYYRFFSSAWIWTDTSCGDNETQMSLAIHITSVFNWDDANKTVTITLANITNQLTQIDSCDQAYNIINIYCNSMQSTYNYTDFSNKTTKCRYKSVFGCGYAPNGSTFGQLYSNTCGYVLMTRGIDVVPEALGGTWCLNDSIYSWFYFHFSTRITALRNDDGSWAQNPLDNFEVYDHYNHETGCYIPSGRLVYKKAGGSVSVKKYYNDYS